MNNLPKCTYAKDERRYLFTGGGTGGHVYPSIVIADYIRSQEPDAKILFVGVRKGAEERIIPDRNYELLTLPSQALPQGNLLEYLSFPVTLSRGFVGAVRILVRYRPQVILGTGGYASAPVVTAGLFLKRLGLWDGRIMIHEQNILPGRLNLWIGRMADVICVSFKETLSFFPPAKSFLTGYPVRGEISQKEKASIKAKWGLPPTSKVLLAFGGSSGARVLNQALWDALPQLLKSDDLYIYHAIGRKQGNYDPQEEGKEPLSHLAAPHTATQRYQWKPYFEDIEQYYAIADLAVCRAGAGTVWEIAQLGIPAILIPKARLPGDHQTKNARFLERLGIARIIYESPKWTQGKVLVEGVEGEDLVTAVQSILYSQEQYRVMANRAKDLDVSNTTKRIYNLILGNPMKERVAPQSPMAVSFPHAHGAVSRLPSHMYAEWMSPLGLLQWLEEHWKHYTEIPPDDLRYIHYKADYLMYSDRWQERNVGVKLAGLIRYRERLALLVEFITDRTPTTRLRRLLGGDFRQVGFIRRNALQAIWRIGTYDSAVRAAFLCGFEDPYYEVRSWTARAVSRMSESVGRDAELELLLRKNLRDRWFEVIVDSAKGLGKVSWDPCILPDIEILLRHNNWKVRDAGLVCLKDLLSRGILKFSPELEAQLEKVQITCLDFSPYFPIRKTLEEFQKTLYESKRLITGTPEMEVHENYT